MSKLLTTTNLPRPSKDKYSTKQASKHQSNKCVRWDIRANRTLGNKWLIHETYRNVPSRRIAPPLLR